MDRGQFRLSNFVYKKEKRRTDDLPSALKSQRSILQQPGGCWSPQLSGRILASQTLDCNTIQDKSQTEAGDLFQVPREI